MERTSKHIIELSLCGLGQVAPDPLLGMMKKFPKSSAPRGRSCLPRWRLPNGRQRRVPSGRSPAD